MKELTQTYLKQLLTYNSNTGIFIRNVTIGAGLKNKIVGSKTKTGYLKIVIDGKEYLAHRLAFLYMTGILLPRSQILDHIDGNRINNIWSNLRLASDSENKANSKLYVTNKQGIKGLSLNQRGYYFACITFKGIRKHITTKDKEYAINWLADTRKDIHGSFANHGNMQTHEVK